MADRTEEENAQRSPNWPTPSVEENLLDKIVGFFSPHLRARRLRARALGDMMAGGAFHAADSSRRSMKQWNVPSASADAAMLDSIPKLRNRSRDLIRNTPLATGAVSTNVMSVVGGGIRVKPKVDREVLGISEEDARAWERRAQTIFRTWAEDEEADLTREETFHGLQALAFRSVLESGDVLVVRRQNRRPGDVLGLQVQLVEADRVNNPQYQPNTESLRAGVERDEDGSPVAYHVQNKHPGDDHLIGGLDPDGGWSRVPAYGPNSGERMAFLLYERRRPNQTRGVPYLAPVIEPLKQLDRYSEAELMGTVISSMLTVFIKAESEIYGTGGGENWGLPNEPQGEVGLSDGSVDAGDVELGQGSVVELAPGEDIETVDPSRPNEAFGDFMRAVLTQVGAGLDLPLEVLTKHFQSSFSAARGALMEAWRAFRTRREWLTRRFNARVYSWAIAEAVDRGMLDAPGFFEDPVLRRAWLNARWIGPARGSIRPDRQVKAAKERIGAGLSTREEEVARTSGADWEKVTEQLGREEEKRRDEGLTGSETEDMAPPEEERGAAAAGEGGGG